MIRVGASDRPGAIRVILIEDQEEHRALVRASLFPEDSEFRLRYKLIEAASLGEGLALVPQEYSYEEDCIVLLDLDLPDSVPSKTLESIALIRDRVPVILLTSMSERELGERALAVGAQDFIPKLELTPSLLERSIRYAQQRFIQLRNLELLTRELQRSNNDLQEFAQLVKDEIFNSLSSLAHYRNLSGDESQVGDPLGGAVNRTMQALENMESITDLAFEYANLGFALLPEGISDLNAILEELEQELENRHRKSYLTVEHRDYLPPVRGHVARVKRIFVSIFDLFSLDSSEDLPVSLRIELIDAGKKVVVCVAGAGVHQTDSSAGRQAFLVFRKLYSSSMGISLYVVERCMDRLGGKIWVETSSATGFKVFLEFEAA